MQLANHRCGGFTLVELMISITIILLLTSVVVVRFSSFDSTTLLKSAAYELATTIREAQVYSVSVLGNDDPTFDLPYGVTFTPGARSYTLFQYIGLVRPTYDGSAADVYTRIFDRSAEISDICIVIGGTETCSSSDPGLTQLDISFQRPEFIAIITASGYNDAENDSIESVLIKLSTPNGDNEWVVEVGVLGHISVKQQP